MRDITGMLDRAAEDAQVVFGHLPETLRRIGEYQARGYPSQSGAGGSRGGSELTIPERHAERRDPFAYDEDRATNALHRVWRDLAELAAIVHRYQPVEASVPDVESCVSCRRLAHFSPVHRRDVCSWCGSFQAEWGQHPPVSVLRQHIEGRRVYEQDIITALRGQPKLTKKKRGKGRRPSNSEGEAA